MRTQFKSALPFVLMAAPLLLGAKPASAEDSVAAYPSAPSRYGQHCNAEFYEAQQLTNPGRRQSVDAIAQPTHSSDAIVTSETELNSVARENASAIPGQRLYQAVRRLLLSNPYADAQQADIEQAINDCMALIREETLIAQADDPLPILGPVNSGPIAPNPASLPTEPVRTEPAPMQQPLVAPIVESIVEPAQTRPPQAEPVSTPSRASQASESLPTSSSSPRANSIDPTNVTPTAVNPTPFSGAPITTLAARADGNYRYVAGAEAGRTYTDAELQQQNRAIFVLRKEGNRVVGELMPRLGEAGVCIVGVASGDRISGFAYLPDPSAGISAYSGALQFWDSTAVAASEGIASANAVLDLAGFSMVNAGSMTPPKSCAE